MIHNIFKTLFVFAILFGNIAPTQAMTLEEYWAATDAKWNVWYDDGYYSIYNIDCSDSQYKKNPCCQFLDDNLKTSENAKKIYIEAFYDSAITSQEDAKEATPKECRYASNHCYSCKLSINSKNQITGNCLITSYEGTSEVTCPSNFVNYAYCEDPINQESTIENINITTFADNCSCENETAFMMANNYCCPAGYYCPDGTQIQCPAGYYCPDGTQTKCPDGTYSDPGATICSPCPTGYYCPDGTQIKCPEPWSLSAAGSDDINDCYVTLVSSVSSNGGEGTLQYIDNNKIKTINVTDAIPNTTEAKNLRGHKYPGGPTYHPNTGKEECLYEAAYEDTAQNIKIWLKDACPLATQTNSVTDIQNDSSYRIGTICHAEVTITTACGKIRKEAVPLDDSTEKYLTYKGGAEVNGHFYLTLNEGLYAEDLLSDNYCTSGTDKKQYYRTAWPCPGGKYCDGFPNGAPNCPDDGTNPDKFPPTGDVAAGYYSTNGAYQEKPTKPGQGCLSGYNCGQCPAGSISPAGATSCSTCSDGTYSDASGATTCKDCEAGYYCTDGNRYTCPAGSTSYEKATKKTQCYIKGGEDGTKFCVNSNCFNIQSDVEAYYSGNTSQ